MNGYKINDNLYINCNNVDYVSFLNDKVKIHMNDNASYYITPEQYADIETKISQSGGGGGASITSNIKVMGNKSDILGTTEHNKLCILSNTGELSFKVVDKIEGGGSEEISTLSEVLPNGLQGACCARYNDNIYIFGGNNGNIVNTIYKFNCITKTISTLSITLPQKLVYACCSAYNDNIYIFGGNNGSTVNTIYKFNCITETISTLSITLPQLVSAACCSLFDSNIYIFGGYNSNSNKSIYKFDCTTETISTLNIILPKELHTACCSTYNDNIYIFGGIVGGTYSNTIYKFNCTNKTIENLSITLPQGLSGACCANYVENIYIFGGLNGNYLNTIYKFNCSNETITTLSVTLPQILYRACCSLFDSNIYIFGGLTGSGTPVNIIYDFSLSFDLTANNVLIYNANSKYSFDLITDQVTIPINKVYIGDSTNTAQLANAYLYDQSKSAWVNVNTGEVLTL